MGDVWTILSLSLKVALWATAINLVLGVALGWLLARKRFVGRELLDTLCTLPMVLPPTVLGYYLLVPVRQRARHFSAAAAAPPGIRVSGLRALCAPDGAPEHRFCARARLAWKPWGWSQTLRSGPPARPRACS